MLIMHVFLSLNFGQRCVIFNFYDSVYSCFS
uniref:Uncharacterized protein n=1 Tax=Rhizophora mucronata TaxID=61149 RepID=A0A2P2N4K1_RHIMU